MVEKNGAGDGSRTRDQRLGKPMRYHCATPALFDGKWILWALETQVKVTGHKGFRETPSPRYGGHLSKAKWPSSNHPTAL